MSCSFVTTCPDMCVRLYEVYATCNMIISFTSASNVRLAVQCSVVW
jgi:hypothetical protein